MQTDHRARLREIRTFPQLRAYLRDEMGWPIGTDDFEELTFEYTAEELGIDAKNAAKIQEIKRLRPLVPNQPWGIFFVKFEPKRLPVVALRRILSQVALKKRASANRADRVAWAADDLLFISNYGEGDQRRIAFAHFAAGQDGHNLPTLKVLGWDNLDTPLHLDDIAEKLTRELAWPEDNENINAWRERWRGAFTLRYRESITTAKELSLRLAELARAIRDRIQTALAIETETGPLTTLMKAFREGLVHDLDATGFADMYAQTVAYGLLSARIADPESKSVDDLAVHMRTNPFLRELLETFLHVGVRRGDWTGSGIDFDELGVSDVVTLLNHSNMGAVVRDFGDRNPQEDPVIHFYEHFLAAYDRKQKVQRGVFYTPRPVVSYIVRSVDELLRTELGLIDGLADTTTWREMADSHEGLAIPDGVSEDQSFVQILDPATGTGTFLVEAVDVIHKTMIKKWKAQGHQGEALRRLWNDYVPKELLPRLNGYELLMAPYSIAHLKIGLKLYEPGYRFASGERARVYLTNSLEPPVDYSDWLTNIIPALAHEAQAVNEVKRDGRFTVILGNPPYANLSANLSLAARQAVARYKRIDAEPVYERNALQLERNVNDDYVKFLALAEDVLSPSPVGAIGFITNNSYLDAQTLRGVRAQLLATNSLIDVVDLGGSGDLSGIGASLADENVFDIQQGVCVTLALRKDPLEGRLDRIRYTRLLGTRSLKYATLDEAAVGLPSSELISSTPPLYLFLPQSGRALWDRYIGVDEAFRVYAEGLKTGFDKGLIGFSVEEAHDKLAALSARDWGARHAHADEEERGWAAGLASDPDRTASLARAAQGEISQFLYRPFDFRFAPVKSKLIKAPSRVAGKHLERQLNLCLIAARQVSGPTTATHFFVSRGVPESRVFYSRKGTASYFPLVAASDSAMPLQVSSLIDPRTRRAFELSLGMPWRDDGDQASAELTPWTFLRYSYAVFHSPTYRDMHRDLLLREFPRIPIPISSTVFKELVALGRELIDLHLMESAPWTRDPLSTRDLQVQLFGASAGLMTLSGWMSLRPMPGMGTSQQDPARLVSGACEGRFGIFRSVATKSVTSG